MSQPRRIARSSIVTRRAVFVLISLLGAGLSIAQEKETPDNVQSNEKGDDQTAIKKVGSIFVAPTKDGQELLPVLDMTIEEYWRLKRMQEEQRQPDNAPRFHFADLSITGAATESQVSLEMLLEITTHDDGWVRVPLQLGSSVIETSEFTGEGKRFLEYDKEEAAYFAWIFSEEADTNHKLKLKLLDRVSKTGNEHRLQLDLPRVVGTRGSPTMVLQVPVEQATGVASSGQQARPVEAKPQGNRTELRVTQPAGEFSLAWRSTKTVSAPSKPVVFDASSRVVVKWDSQSRVVWEANLTLNVLQGQLSTATIELPPGTRLLGQGSPGQLVLGDDSNEADPTASAKVSLQLERTIAQGQSGEISLSCERQLDPRETGNSDTIEIAGFRVEGAARQTGTIGIVAASVWRIDREGMTNIFRPDEMPASFREEGIRGSNTYQILSHPCSLRISVAPRERHVTLSPTYLLHVHREQVSLEARLAYRVTGRSLSVCTAILPGWDITAIDLIDGETVESLEFDPPTESFLDIDLPRDMRGEFELRIRAMQSTPGDADFLVVNLPSVEDEHSASPKLIVSSDDNIDVQYDADRSNGISPLAQLPAVKLPPRLYPPQYYQINEISTASFAAEIALRPQHVVVTSQATVDVVATGISMQQRLLYDVRHEPIEFLELDTPKWWMNSDAITFKIDGSPVSPEILPDISTETTVRLSLPLGSPRVGSIAVAVAYQLETSPLQADQDVAATVSFARPAQADVIAPFRLTIKSNDEVRWEVDGDDYRVDATEIGGGSLIAETIPTSTDLLLNLASPSATESTIVERAWIQSWLTGNGRQERVVFRILTNAPELVIELPESAQMTQPMVVVDGNSRATTSEESGQLILPLNQSDAAADSGNYRRHVVELGWTQPPARGYLNRISPELPVIRDAWIQHLRWQVLTPRNDVAFSVPGGLAGDLWPSLPWWSQKPDVSQRDLEFWSGATQQPSPESIGQAAAYRQYDFSAIGTVAGKHVTIGSASLAMLVIASVVLVFGVLLVQLRQLRHPAVLIGLAFLVATVAFQWPAIALFAGQILVLLTLVTVVSRILTALLTRTSPLSFLRSRSASTVSTTARPSTHIRRDAALVGSPSTTANVGHALPGVPSELP